MKNSFNLSSSDSKRLSLAIFYTQVSNNEIQIIQKILSKTYSHLVNFYKAGELGLLDQAYNQQRNQYDAELLLKIFLKQIKTGLSLWVINKDIYCTNMNFIFGYAMYYKAAILSTFRLTSQDLIEKEAVHEVGHVLGLNHCKNHCVMQFSNSLWEAKNKPCYLCEYCKRKIKFFKNH